MNMVGSESIGATKRALNHGIENLMTIIADSYHMGLKYNVSYNGDITNKYG
jgi:hypothetical protein